MSAVEFAHADLLTWLVVLLGNYAESKGGSVLLEPFQLKVNGPRESGRAPDLMFIVESNQHRIKRLFVDGPADLVIEIVSAGSRTIDRRDKFDEYAAGGVPEYWILDPMQKRAEFFQLEGDRYKLGPIDDAGIYASRVLAGVVIEPQWLWDMPKTSTILPRWGVS